MNLKSYQYGLEFHFFGITKQQWILLFHWNSFIIGICLLSLFLFDYYKENATIYIRHY